MIKLSFEEFLNKIYGMGLGEYMELNDYQKKAVNIHYKDRYN